MGKIHFLSKKTRIEEKGIKYDKTRTVIDFYICVNFSSMGTHWFSIISRFVRTFLS